MTKDNAQTDALSGVVWVDATVGPLARQMSLRDWFAGQALQAMGTFNPHLPGDLPDEPWPEPALLVRRRAIWAYLHADAMLAERAKVR